MIVKNKPSITAFFPCYNDEHSIRLLIAEMDSILNKITNNYEIIVIDDYSQDNSREVLKNLSDKFKNLKLIFHSKNLGYGGAIKRGFKEASKDLIFYTDGDGQYDVKEFPLLLSLMTDDVNFINGIKMQRGDAEYRVIFGNLHKFITRWLFWLPITDVDCDFRLIRKNLVDKIKLTSNSGSVCVELVKKADKTGAVFREVSVHHFNRKFGTSQFFRLNKIIHTYFDLTRLWISIML